MSRKRAHSSEENVQPKMKKRKSKRIKKNKKKREKIMSAEHASKLIKYLEVNVDDSNGTNKKRDKIKSKEKTSTSTEKTTQH